MDLPDPGMEPGSPALQADSLPRNQRSPISLVDKSGKKKRGGGRWVGGGNATKCTVVTTWIFPGTVSVDRLWKISSLKIEKRTYRPQSCGV